MNPSPSRTPTGLMALIILLVLSGGIMAGAISGFILYPYFIDDLEATATRLYETQLAVDNSLALIKTAQADTDLMGNNLSRTQVALGDFESILAITATQSVLNIQSTQTAVSMENQQVQTRVAIDIAGTESALDQEQTRIAILQQQTQIAVEQKLTEVQFSIQATQAALGHLVTREALASPSATPAESAQIAPTQIPSPTLLAPEGVNSSVWQWNPADWRVDTNALEALADDAPLRTRTFDYQHYQWMMDWQATEGNNRFFLNVSADTKQGLVIVLKTDENRILSSDLYEMVDGKLETLLLHHEPNLVYTEGSLVQIVMSGSSFIFTINDLPILVGELTRPYPMGGLGMQLASGALIKEISVEKLDH
ncbi:hypothetical protein MASR2M15_05450 [Anaerolineales bacterium]